MLDHLRVVDLTDQEGVLCTYLLVQLGAEVITVEPPGGLNMRRLEPRDRQTGQGLWWEAYGRGKQSRVLDIEVAEDHAALLKMLAEADVLVEAVWKSGLVST